ncbi:MAG: HNH endonuclease [Candidatus Bathyarchaeota archaeon]
MVRYWKISPENFGPTVKSRENWEKQWSRCVNNGKIAVGWDYVGDLTDLDINQIKDKLLEGWAIYQQPNYSSRLTLDAKQLFNFKNIEVSDIIVVNRGQSEIVGVGKVEGDYYFDDDVDYFKHTISVNWLDTTRRIIEKQMDWLPTVIPLDYQRIVNLGLSGVLDRDRTIENYEKILNKGGTFSEKTGKSRLFQQAFRNVLLANYQSKCAVCDIDNKAFLRGCHIVPVAEDESICTDITNGICLCVIHDIAFEKGFFSISGNYNIKVSESFKTTSGSLQSTIINLDGKKISLPTKSYPNKSYLKRHREKHGF